MATKEKKKRTPRSRKKSEVESVQETQETRSEDLELSEAEVEERVQELQKEAMPPIEEAAQPEPEPEPEPAPAPKAESKVDEPQRIKLHDAARRMAFGWKDHWYTGLEKFAKKRGFPEMVTIEEAKSVLTMWGAKIK